MSFRQAKLVLMDNVYYAVHAGRPKNTIKYCKVCNVELSITNTRETKAGSQSLRSTCIECERAKDRERKQGKYQKKPHHGDKISRGPMFAERLNRVGMRAQTATIVQINTKKKEKKTDKIVDFVKHVTVFTDMVCPECDGAIRYDEHLERVCESCGLIGEVVMYDQSNSEFAGRELTPSEKSKYDLKIFANRDSEIDRQHSGDGNAVFNTYTLTPVAGTFDPQYSKYYKKSLNIVKIPDYYNKTESLKLRYQYD